MSDESFSEGQLHQVQPPANKLRGPVVLLVLAAMTFGAGAYSIHEHKLAKSTEAQNAAMLSSLETTHAEVAQLTAKLNELTAPKPSPEVPVRQRGVKHPPDRRVRRVVHHHAEDRRWRSFQSRLDEQGKAIESTRQDLASAKTELNDSIARNHADLVVMQRKGERNYYEFDIDKSKHFQYLGPMGIRLRKANVKHQYADLELLVDDRSLTKKHVNLYEPVMLYTSDSPQPVQVVINSVTKNHIRGYISEPKYTPAQLAAMSPANPQGTGKPRQKLTLPQ